MFGGSSSVSISSSLEYVFVCVNICISLYNTTACTSNCESFWAEFHCESFPINSYSYYWERLFKVFILDTLYPEQNLSLELDGCDVQDSGRRSTTATRSL